MGSKVRRKKGEFDSYFKQKKKIYRNDKAFAVPRRDKRPVASMALADSQFIF